MRPGSIAVLLLASVATHLEAVEFEAYAVAAEFTYAAGIERGESVAAELNLQPSVELALSDRQMFIASARFRLDAEDRLEPGRTNTESYSPLAKPLELGTAGSAELRDFYLELRRRNGLLRIGKQQIVWGRLDGIKVLDILNPQDFREFILDDFAESRISLWSIYADYSFGPWRTEFAILPDGTGHAIPRESAWFELSAPRFRFGSDAPATLPIDTERPGSGLADTGLGLRLSRQFGGLDLSAVAYSGLDPEPLGRRAIVSDRTVLQRYYERRNALGLSLDFGLGPLVLRGETVLMPNRHFNLRDSSGLGDVERDQIRAAIGIDYSAPFGVFANLQYLVDRVRAAPASLVRPGTDRIGTLFMRRSFAFDRLDAEFRWYHSFTDSDDMSSLGLNWRVNDRLSLGVTLENFSGRSTGLFGQFANRDRALLRFKYLL